MLVDSRPLFCIRTPLPSTHLSDAASRRGLTGLLNDRDRSACVKTPAVGTMHPNGELVQEDDFRKVAMLRTSIRKGDIKLLKASWLADQAEMGTLTSFNRNSLEKNHPEAFADIKMVERALLEVEQGGQKTWCVYPALVLLSFCWQTAENPDPSGSLKQFLELFLNWYAAQRARFTQDRLYWGTGLNGEAFDLDFCVFLDCWSLHQQPRSKEQEESYVYARKSMNVLFAHRASTVLAVPDDFKASGEVLKAGGPLERGSNLCERNLAALCKIPGQNIDIAGFEAMLAKDESGAKRAVLKTPFPRLSGDELRAAAFEDCNGSIDSGSCLEMIVKARQLPPMPPADMAALLQAKAFDSEEARADCISGYEDAVSTILAAQEKMSFLGATHWGANELEQLGESMSLCHRLTDLWLCDCSMGDAGAAAFADALEPGCAPKLAVLHLAGNSVGEAGCVALASALSRGACPALRMVSGISGSVQDKQRVAAAGGALVQVALSGEMLTVTRTPAAAAPSLLAGIDLLSSGTPGAAIDRESLIPVPQSLASVTPQTARTTHAAAAGAGGGAAAQAGAAQPSDVKLAGVAGDVSEGWELLRPPPAQLSEAGKQGSWVDMAMDRTSSLRNASNTPSIASVRASDEGAGGGGGCCSGCVLS